MKHNTWQLLESAVLETLEDRRMMSASPLSTGISMQGGTLSLKGDASQPTQMVVDYAASDHSLLYARIGSNQQFFPVSQIKQIDVNAGNGNDYVYISPKLDINADINVGNGANSIHAGGGNANITGGNGNNFIYSSQGDNKIHLGDGDNRVLGAAGNDTIIAGNGNDYIYGGGGNDSITTGTGDSTLIGAAGDDTLVAGNGNNFLNGGLGNDKLTAGTGQDVLMGYSGNDNLAGGGANSVVQGGAGTDIIASIAAPQTTVSTGNTVSSGNTSSSGSTTTNTAKGTPTTGSSNTGSTSGSTGTTSTGSTGTTKSGSTGSTTSGTGTTTSGSGATTTPVVANTGNSQSTKTTIVTGRTVKVDANAKAPTPNLKVLDGPRQTGLVVNVDALASTLAAGTALTANYAWNFGDPGTAYNTLTGFNAAHVYDKPGTYTITLTVTNENGGQAVTTQKVTIAASTRKQIFVDSANGSDSNNGSQAAPYKTLAQAITQVGANTELLLHAGQRFDVTGTLHINSANVLVGSYGTGAAPVLNRILGNGVSTIATYGNANGVTFQGLTFDSPYGVSANSVANEIGVSAIYVGGSNITVRNCNFLNVDDAVNENGYPTGVLVQNNTAPLATGIRGYFLWGMGWQGTVLGNSVANSTRQHNIRLVDCDEINIQNNNLANIDRRSVDSGDYSKGAIEMHRGEYAYIVGNTTTGGDIRTGPLGLHGESVSSATEWCVIEDNIVNGSQIALDSGSHHILVDNNVIYSDKLQAIAIDGVDGSGRTSEDITLTNNTAIDNTTAGNFVRVGGYVDGIVMTHNLFIAPHLNPSVNGGGGAVAAFGSGLSSFTTIADNIWPDAPTINSVNGSAESNTQWNQNSQVHGDVFQTVQLSDTYQMTLGSLTAGADLKAAA